MSMEFFNKLFVIYDHPRDCPTHIVVRPHSVYTDGQNSVSRPHQFGVAFDTVEEAREGLPEGLINIGRMESDDPVIVEVWG